MYVTLSDRPAAPRRTGGTTGRPPRARRVPRTVVALGMVSLLTDVSSESVAAILPLYLTAVVGLSPVAYGLVDSIYQGGSAVVRLAGGWVADRTARPHPVALLGYGLSATARAFLLFASGLAAVSAVIGVDRVGKGLRTAPRDAMISASSHPDDLGRAFGVHRALDTVGAVLGPLIAFALVWWIADGYRSVLVVSLGFAVLGVAVLVLFVPRDTGGRPRSERHGERRAQHRPGPRLADVAQAPMLRLLGVAGLLGVLTVGDAWVYLALWEAGGLAAHWFPVLYVGTSVVYLLLAVPVGILADRVGRARVLVLGHVPLVGAYLCAAAGGTAATVGALALLGLFYAATDGVLSALAARLVPESVRSTGIATAQTAVAFSRSAATASFGLLWYLVGPSTALVGIAVALALAVPIGLVVLRGQR